MHSARRSLTALLTLCFLATSSSRIYADAPYLPNWDSLRKHTPAPDWFRDAKFGIYFHWGVYSVPAYGNEWYPRHMHDVDNERIRHYYEHHKTTYGDPSEFGYDQFVPMFTAEKFNADEWIELFDKAGAKFAGPVAEHHDGFAMWNSQATPWNSADRGPKRDILGEIATAARKRGMKVVATFHHARNNLWEVEKNGKKVWTGHYSLAKQHFPDVLENSDRAILYGYMPRDQFLDMWLAKLGEVVEQYQPDLIWFDSWLHEIPDEVKAQFLATYLNHAAANGKEVVITYKQEDLPQDIGVLDLEKGGMGELTEFSWLTDDTISLGSWCYTRGLKIKPTHVVLHSLVDIVSKNGQLLLNISPKADGTIPENQQQVLLELGQWLRRFGEAIYGTRPFVTYGHGPTTAGKGHFGGIATDKGYTANDIRYTRNGNTVYAIQLGWPGRNQVTKLLGFASKEGAPSFEVSAVSMLGTDEAVEWEQTDDGLAVTTPSVAPDTMAVVYKIATSSLGE